MAVLTMAILTTTILTMAILTTYILTMARASHDAGLRSTATNCVLTDLLPYTTHYSLATSYYLLLRYPWRRSSTCPMCCACGTRSSPTAAASCRRPPRLLTALRLPTPYYNSLTTTHHPPPTTQHPTLQHPNTPTPTTHYTYRIPQYTYRIPLQEGAFDFLLYVGAMMVIYTHD